MKFTPHIASVNALLRVGDALALTGDSQSGFYQKVSGGLMTKPVKIGARATAVPVREIEAINAARIRGASEDEIKALVSRLHADRANAN